MEIGTDSRENSSILALYLYRIRYVYVYVYDNQLPFHNSYLFHFSSFLFIAKNKNVNEMKSFHTCMKQALNALIWINIQLLSSH